jgi:dCMP deaminase
MPDLVPRQSWDEWFLGLAEYVSKRSKDPSTQCGAVIARPDNTIASLGYNGFPRSIDDAQHLLRDRDEKYKRVIHAEMNAILNAREPLSGCTLYTWPFLTCERCAVHVLQAGIVRVVARPPSMDALERWHHSFKLARDLYREAGIVVVEEKGYTNGHDT